jgi:hypothetical protein
MAWEGMLAALAWLLPPVPVEAVAAPAKARPIIKPRRAQCPARAVLPVDAQWQRVHQVVERAIHLGQAAAELHAKAALRLDSTEYEILLLKRDLAHILAGQRALNA